MGGVCVRVQENPSPNNKPSSEPSRSGKQHELPIHLLPPEAKTIRAQPKRRTFSDLYKLFKYEFSEELKTIRAYPVSEIWEYFEKGEVLGKGGYGEVVVVQRKAERALEIPDLEIPTDQKFAMKTMPQIRKEKSSFPAFENEVKIHSKLENHNIVKFHASFVSAESYYIITELCTGGEVFDRVVSHKRFSESVATIIVKQMLLSLKHCHDNNFVHRDLKPSNFVFATRDGSITEQAVKLIDFGLAKAVEDLVIYPDKVGTPFYVSPETIDSHHPFYNQRTGKVLKSSDMWAIGAIVFVLITGKLPFPGKKHKDIFKNISKCRYKFPDSLLLSDSVKDFISSLLNIDPIKRFTCDQALQHPWIANADAAPKDPLSEVVLQGLNQLQRQTKLSKAVGRIAINHLTDKDISNLQDLFAAYDKDRSGQIEISELIQLLKDTGFDDEAAEQEALQLMEDLDSNRDGALTMVEFAQAAAGPRASISRTMVKKTFDSMDSDRDGMISSFELKGSLGDMLDDNYIEKIFRNADHDKDGMLTFEEFLEAMKVTIKTRREKPKMRKSVMELSFSSDPAPPTNSLSLGNQIPLPRTSLNPQTSMIKRQPIPQPEIVILENEDDIRALEDKL